MSSEHDDLFWAALPLPPECADDEPGFAEEFGVSPGEIRAWLAKDPARQLRADELAAELDEDLAGLIQLRHGRTLPPIMSDFTDRVMAEVTPQAPQGRLIVFRRYGLAAAAALLCAVTLGALWGGGTNANHAITAKQPDTEQTLPRRSADDVLQSLPVVAYSVPTPALRPGVSPRSMRSLDPQVPVGRASGGAGLGARTGADLLLQRFMKKLPSLREDLEDLRSAGEPTSEKTFRF